MLAEDGLGHFVVNTGGAEGADTLSGIEKITDGGGHHILLVGNGGYATITAAIAAASAGDIIRIAAGTYSEHVDVNKDVTLEGANHGIAGNGARGAETVITGGVKVSATGASVDGVAISGSYDTIGTPDITAPSHIGLLIGGANVTVQNTVLTGDALDSRPFGTFSSATGLSFDHNLVQDWTRAAYFTAGSNGSITGNAFVDNAGGVFSEGMSFVVTGNTFSGSTGADVGGYITSATFDIGTVVHDNTHSAGVAQPIGVYVFGGDGQIVNGTDTATNFHLEYHSGTATVHGGAGSDAISYSDDGAGVTINLARHSHGRGRNDDVHLDRERHRRRRQRHHHRQRRSQHADRQWRQRRLHRRRRRRRDPGRHRHRYRVLYRNAAGDGHHGCGRCGSDDCRQPGGLAGERGRPRAPICSPASRRSTTAPVTTSCS